MSDENKKNDENGTPSAEDVKDPGLTVNKTASNDVAGTAPVDAEPKPGGATPEQQEKAAELQNADPAAQTTSEPSDSPAAETKPSEVAERPTEAPTTAHVAEKPAVDPEREAKIKAAQEARAARLAAKAAAEGGEAPAATADTPAAEGEAAADDKEAKAKAAAEARAARAAARAAAAAPAEPEEPSPKQPVLDRLVQIIKESINEDAVEENYINRRDAHIPTVVVKSERWFETANVLKQHAELKLHYLRSVTGVDVETHMEVIYHLISFDSKQNYCFKVKTPRDQASVPSVTPIWSTANWNEREIYDLFGIEFTGHPDLRRIMMPDDWVGHPLRKDYEPLDPEV